MMNQDFSRKAKALFFALALWAPSAAFAQGDAFTYQGGLKEDGIPATGDYDFEFSLFDAPSGGTLLAGPAAVSAVPVANGLFTVGIDFGINLFDGSAYFLETAVQPTGGGGFTALAPRVELTAAPNAHFARLAGDADTLDGAHASDLFNQSFALNGNDLELTDGSGTLTVDLAALGGAGSDDDITAVTFAGNMLTVEEGATVFSADLSSLDNPGTDDQTLSLAGASLSIEDGNSVDLSPLIDDADADAANELNTGAGFAANVLSVTDAGGSVTADLSSIQADWANLQNVPAGFADGFDNVNDADSDPANEIETWATLAGIPAGFADDIDNVNDADADPANERNTRLQLVGTVLELEDSGGTLAANLASLGGGGAGDGHSLDADDGDPVDALYVDADGNVGIGDTAPDSKLVVSDIGDLGGLTLRTADSAHSNGLLMGNPGGDYTWTMFREDAGSNDADLVFSGGRDADPANLSERLRIAHGTGLVTAAAFAGDGSALTGINVSDADADPANERNTRLQLVGTVLELEDSGGTLAANLASLGGGGAGDGHSLDADDGLPVDALYVNADGNVGIGTTTPLAGLHVVRTAEGSTFELAPLAEVFSGDGEFSHLLGAASVFVSGNIAYVASISDSSLTVMDVSNPSDPQLLAEVFDGDGQFNRLRGARSVFVLGTTAYVVAQNDSALTTIDVSDPSNPQLLAEVFDNDGEFSRLLFPFSVFVSGTTAYVASAGDSSLTVIDVSDPANPQLLAEVFDNDGEFSRLGGAASVFVSGTTAYVASSADRSLTTMDVSNPANPQLLAEVFDNDGEFSRLDGAISVFVSGTTAYVASAGDDSLTVMDVSDPSDPALLAEVFDDDGQFNRLDGAFSVSVSGTTAYVASSGDDSLTAVDVSDPANPRLLAEVFDSDGQFNRLDGAFSVFASGGAAYVASANDSSLTIARAGFLGVASIFEGFVGIGTTTPATELHVVGTITADSLNVGAAISATTFAGDGSMLTNLPVSGDGHSLDAVDGAPVDALFVNADGNVGIGTTSPQAGLHIVRSEPTFGLLAEAFDGDGQFERLENARGVFVSGTVAYVAAGSDRSVTLVDVSDPTDPRLLAQVTDGVGGFNRLGQPVSIFVEGGIAYVTSLEENSLTIMDVSDPSNPQLLAEAFDGDGQFNRLEGPRDVFVSGTTAYVVSQTDDSLTVVDVSDPSAPLLLAEVFDEDGEFSRLDGAVSVHVSGTTAYVASSEDDSLTVIDVSNPSNPQLLAEVFDEDGEFSRLDRPFGVHVSGTTAYVASTNDHSLTVMDVSNPANPQRLAEVFDNDGQFTRLRGARDVFVSGTTAYVVGDGDHALTAIDVSNPSDPRLLAEAFNGDGQFNRLFGAFSVHESAGVIYVASYLSDSLTIVQEVNAMAPTMPLALMGNGGTSPVGITQNQVGGTATMELTTADGSGSQATRLLLGGGADGADIEFYTGARGAEVQTVRIEGGSGHVGIGTDTPGAALHARDSVTGSGNFVGIVQNTANNGDSWGLLVQAGADVHTGLNSRMIAFQRPDGTEIGAVRQISSSAVDYFVPSDRRLKTNFAPASRGLADLLAIDVLDYEYKADPGRVQTGFVAQQLAEHYPDAVSEGGGDADKNPWMVSYGRLAPLMVKAIQEQQTEVDALRAEKDAQIELLADELAESRERERELEALLAAQEARLVRLEVLLLDGEK